MLRADKKGSNASEEGSSGGLLGRAAHAVAQAGTTDSGWRVAQQEADDGLVR
jgi:hypothetical protein